MWNLPPLAVRPVHSLALLLIALAMGGGVNRSAAALTTITFESLPGPDGKLNTADDVPIDAPGSVYNSPDQGTDRYQITNQYESLGLKFIPYPYYITNQIVNEASESPIGTPRNNIMISAYPYFETPAYIRGEFLLPVRTFSIDLVFDTNRYVTIFGANGKLSELFGKDGTRTFTAAEDIVSFEIWGNYLADYEPTAIDNVSFSVVPEPATLAAAAVVLALANRRSRPAR